MENIDAARGSVQAQVGRATDGMKAGAVRCRTAPARASARDLRRGPPEYVALIRLHHPDLPGGRRRGVDGERRAIAEGERAGASPVEAVEGVGAGSPRQLEDAAVEAY